MATSDSISPDELASSDMATQLRQRRIAAKFNRAIQSPNFPPNDSSPSSSVLPKDRKSSLRTDSFRTSSSSFDNKPFSLRQSTGDLLSPQANDTSEDSTIESSLWHSFPLLLAILPAIGGLAFKSGSVVLTDLSLLGLATIYLNWFLVTPWTWYQSARSVHIIRPIGADVAIEDSGDEENVEDIPEDNSKATMKDAEKAMGQTPKRPEIKDPKAIAAIRELQWQELFALLMCFIGPVLGAYLLNIIRGSLSTIGHELISDLHLTLFVMGAEIRPMRHAVKLVHARTLHLQKIVREDTQSIRKVGNGALTELSGRLDELETSFTELAARPIAETPSTPAADSSDQFKKAHSALQTQIDALNRAVRRYEKRATAQTMQTEARLQDLEIRLREALSLAAVAATYAQKPGMIPTMLERFASLVFLPLKLVLATVMQSLAVLNIITTEIMVRFGLAAPHSQDISKQRGFGKKQR